jgi:hypothetical protein
MKPRIFKTSTFAAIVLSLATMASCVKDSEHSLVFGEGEGLPVVISLAPAIGNQSPTRTRGYHDGQELEDGGGVAGSPAVGSAKDTAISDIMVLLYQSSSGIYAGQDRAEVDGSGDPVSLDVLTGTYDIVVVANAFPSGSDATNGSFLGNFFATPANYDQIGEVKNALLDAAAFGESKNIPMFTIAAGVHIGLGGVVNNIDTNSTAWSPTLTRAGVRLSLEITLTKWQHEGWLEAAGAGNAPKVTVSNVPAQNWLHDETGKPNDAPLGANRTYGAAEAADASDPQPVTGFDGYMWHVAADAANNIEEHWIVRYDRIILPEFIPADKEDDDTAMHLSMDLGDGNVVEGEIRCSDLNSWKEGYSLRRNTWLHLDVEVAGARLDVSPQVIPWNNTAGGGEIGDKYWLRVDSPIYIGAEATAWFSLDDHVTTNHSGGYEVIPVSGNNVTYPVAGPSGWLEIDTTTLSYSATSKNEDSAQREAYVRIKAGDLEKEITFIQLPVHAGIHASPGVIGVIVGGPNDGELTLRGSAAYKADARIADAAKIMFPGPDRHQQEAGLSNHNVFVTTFKWGSLVALSTDLQREYFDAGDVIWVPEEYEYSPNPYAARERLRDKIGSKTDEPAWELVPGRKGADARDNLWKMEPAKGLGDPCTFYFGNKWRLPVSNPYYYWNNGVPFGVKDVLGPSDWILDSDSGLGHGGKWIERTTPGNTLLPNNGAVGGDGQGGQDWSWFLPATPHRENAGISFGQGGSDGRYWSGSVQGMDSNGETMGRHLAFNRTSILVTARSIVGGSNAVRCVVNQTRATTLDASADDMYWNDDEYGASFEEPVVVTSDGAWTVTLSGAAAAHFKVTSDTGDISGTIENGAGTITGSGTATFKVTPVSPIYGSTIKATITIIANGTSLSHEIALTHWGTPA